MIAFVYAVENDSVCIRRRKL